MSDKNLSTDDIKDLLYYLERVKSFEHVYTLQTDTMIRLIWGVLLFGASIIDLVLRLFEPGLLIFVPWIVAISSAVLIQEFTSRYFPVQKQFREIKMKYDRHLKSIFLMVIIILITNFSIELAAFQMPAIAILFAYTQYKMDENYYENYSPVLKRNLRTFIPSLVLASGAVNIIGHFLFSAIFWPYGFIFGSFYGGSLLIVSFWNRKFIKQYMNTIGEN
ncbi:MAG: hypothetical protein ACXAEU_00670 [Candidatus Hodarchaeales archaeon]|jgi:hypothetical protein